MLSPPGRYPRGGAPKAIRRHRAVPSKASGMIEAVIFDFDGTLTELTLDFGEIRGEIEKIAQKFVSHAADAGLDNLYILEMISHVEGMIDEAGPRFRREASPGFARWRSKRPTARNLSLREGRAPHPEAARPENRHHHEELRRRRGEGLSGHGDVRGHDKDEGRRVGREAEARSRQGGLDALRVTP